MTTRILDARGDMIALRLQHVSQVKLERRLVAAHDEEIRIALRVDSQKRANALLILIVQLQSVLAFDLVVYAGLLHLEAGRIDKHVELVLFALEHWALLRNLRDALALGVDQVNVVPVEGRQIVVVEAWPLA